MEEEAELMESKATVSLSLSLSLSLSQRIAKVKLRKIRKELYIYRKKKRAEDEVMLSSETRPTEDRHVFWALNASRIEELTK